MRTSQKMILGSVLSLVLVASTFAFSKEDAPAVETACIQPAQWYLPSEEQTAEPAQVVENAAKSPVVLLGEHHDNAQHHRWQLQTITQLYTLNPNMLLGFEMFPRRLQPVLDKWVRGELNEKEFLRESEWRTVWSFDSDLYMPIFHFARMNKLPMVALNVERSLISAVSKNGWDGIDASQKEGVKKPAPALSAYSNNLKAVFAHHGHGANKGDDTQQDAAFARFIEAQLTWDGAMAQKIADVQQMGGNPLVVAIMGTGHLQNRWGVPHQLDALGLSAKVLIPWTVGQDCKDLVAGYGDAVFGLEHLDEEKAAKPRIGIMIEPAITHPGVLVSKVLPDSVGDKAGLKDGDIIVRAGGQTVKAPAQLIDIIQTQAMGSWLPLDVVRDKKPQEIIAKFPPVSGK